MPLSAYLVLSVILFLLGAFGMMERRNLVGLLISVELMLNAASINFMAFNHFLYPGTVTGQIMTLFVIGLAAAEATLFLAIVFAVYRHYRSINVENVDHLRG
ncbi:MAG: NADH-quinone oxidoreductase subunit NuoK [Calditrichaeota bacterium]|nr:NADH-quinone oxidoreductase subunit NuoK [Calditrichota bacterium]MCB9367608.1 NADH-quinone oxidoreductase subunit NuoK [Calditrichota bacterium]